MKYLNSSEFKKLKKIPCKIENIYSFYRSGFVPSLNKFRTFVYTPARITDDVVEGRDERLKIEKGEKLFLREKIWEDGKIKLIRVKEKVDKDFLKLFPKVIDMVVVANGNVDGKKEVITPGEEFTIPVSAKKIQDLLDVMGLSDDVEEDDEGRRPFDWEDKLAYKLKWKFFQVNVTGSGLQTKYSFKVVPEFSVSGGNSIEDDFPTRNHNRSAQEVTIEDISF